jgi:hypothetical protein
VVATDVRVDATDALPKKGSRRGLSAAVSAAEDAGRRLATRGNPQLVQETGWVLDEAVSTLPSGPRREAVAARIEGLLEVTLPPPVLDGQGPLAVDVRLDPARPGRSLRYAENRRWTLPEGVRQALALPADGRPVPHVRAVFTDPGDDFGVRQTVSPPATTYAVTRSGSSGGGWVWARTDQLRRTGRMAGLGVVSADVVALPPDLSLVLADGLEQARRFVAPNDVMWQRSLGWAPTGSQAVVPGGGDLRVEKLVYASFTIGSGTGAAGVDGSYPARVERKFLFGAEVSRTDIPERDEWNLMTATLLRLVDAAAAGQRVTVWMLDGSNLLVPARYNGIAVESAVLATDLDLDRYATLLPVAVRRFDDVAWPKQVEIQLKGYTGAWCLANGDGLLPAIYERPAEDVGDWFLRAVDGIPNIADAYFGNTPGDITGRARPWP